MTLNKQQAIQELLNSRATKPWGIALSGDNPPVKSPDPTAEITILRLFFPTVAWIGWVLYSLVVFTLPRGTTLVAGLRLLELPVLIGAIMCTSVCRKYARKIEQKEIPFGPPSRVPYPLTTASSTVQLSDGGCTYKFTMYYECPSQLRERNSDQASHFLSSVYDAYHTTIKSNPPKFATQDPDLNALEYALSGLLGRIVYEHKVPVFTFRVEAHLIADNRAASTVLKADKMSPSPPPANAPELAKIVNLLHHSIAQKTAIYHGDADE
jgi:hypothetical protein